MRKLAYGGVADWLGIDSDPAAPDAIHADNVDVLRAISLSRFNVFDVDAFGSPWECVWVIGRRRPVAAGERVGVVITTGINAANGNRTPNLHLAGWSLQMCDAIGANAGAEQRWFTGEAFVKNVAPRFLRAWFDGCEIERWLSAKSPGVGARYLAAVLVGG